MDPQPSVTSMPSVSSRVMSGHTNSVAFSDFDYASPRSPAPAPTPKRMTQFSHASESQPDSSTRLMAIQQTQDQLSFFQRYFTKPVDQPTGSKSEWRHRRFSFSARGTLVAAAVLLLLLIAIIAAATATSVHHHHHQQEGQGAAGGNNASKSNSSAGGGGSPNAGSSPIRLAIQANFPDPSLRFVNDTWYAYATNNAAGIINATSHAYDNTEYGQSNVQLATSTDFVNWTIQPATEDPLPLTGTWVVQGSTAPNGLVPAVPNAAVWATSVLLRKTDGKFVLYYAARSSGPSIRSDGSKSHCIGAAVSETESPAGPYIPLNESLVCPYTQGGAIDPYGFVGRAGTPWLLYKVDGNSIGAGGPCSNMEAPQKPTPIMLQKMQSDGITLDGEPIQLLDRTDADGPLIEAPALVRSRQGIHFLFFSSGCTKSSTYNIKYATSKNITGPYTRASEPLLATGDWGLLAPGSVDVHGDARGNLRMAFHARLTTLDGGVRAMYTTQLELSGTVARFIGFYN